ncbi:MAG TPA: hypothetical protein VMV49_17060 [Candidatus Deferrimicrobium sp.]|nr:hypothetical protein [Candidatus Deferrimicrobium sp.]
MAKDRVTIIFGIIYSICVALIWIFLFLPYDYPSTISDFYMASPGGRFAELGAWILIPSTILYIIFFASNEGDYSAMGGFAFGIFGCIIGIIGQIYHLIWFWWFTYPNLNFIPVYMLIFFILLVIFGSLLFIRRNFGEELYISTQEELED